LVKIHFFKIFLFLSRANCVSTEFFQFLPIFTEFYEIRRIQHQVNF
jgi:hypothetical protein